MMRKTLVFCFLLSAFCLAAAAQTVSPLYTFSNCVSHALNVVRVTITPLWPDTNYAGGYLSPYLAPYTRLNTPGLTNGTLRVSNLVNCYVYQVDFYDGQVDTLVTNYFPVNATGNVNALNWPYVTTNLEGPPQLAYSIPQSDLFGIQSIITNVQSANANASVSIANQTATITVTGSGAGGGYPITNTDGTITITTSGGMTNLSAAPVGLANTNLTLHVGANDTNQANLVGQNVTNYANATFLTPSGNGSGLAGITASQVGAATLANVASTNQTTTNAILGALSASVATLNTAIVSATNGAGLSATNFTLLTGQSLTNAIQATNTATLAAMIASNTATLMQITNTRAYLPYVFCPTNNLVPDNRLVFTNLQTAINLYCGGAYQGGTITLGLGEFYQPGGYTFPTNANYMARITGQFGPGSRIVADSNVFWMITVGTPQIEPSITIDNVAILCKSNQNPGFVFTFFGGLNHEVHHCNIARWQYLTRTNNEWFWGAQPTNPSCISLGFLNGDNFNSFHDNVVSGLGAGLVVIGDHNRHYRNQFGDIARFYSPVNVNSAINTNSWSPLDGSVISFANYSFPVAYLSAGGSYITADNGDSTFEDDHFFSSLTGVSLTTQQTPADTHAYGHDKFTREMFESIVNPILVDDGSYNQNQQQGNTIVPATVFYDSVYYGDTIPSLTTLQSGNNFAITAVNTGNASTNSILHEHLVNFSGGAWNWEWDMGSTALLTLDNQNDGLSLVSGYSFYGSLLHATNLPSTSITGQIPPANLGKLSLTNLPSGALTNGSALPAANLTGTAPGSVLPLQNIVISLTNSATLGALTASNVVYAASTNTAGAFLLVTVPSALTTTLGQSFEVAQFGTNTIIQTNVTGSYFLALPAWGTGFGFYLTNQAMLDYNSGRAQRWQCVNFNGTNVWWMADHIWTKQGLLDVDAFGISNGATANGLQALSTNTGSGILWATASGGSSFPLSATTTIYTNPGVLTAAIVSTNNFTMASNGVSGIVLSPNGNATFTGTVTNNNVGISGTLTAPGSASISTGGTLTTGTVSAGPFKATTMAATSSGSLVASAGNLQYFGGQSFVEACGNGTIEGTFAIDCAISSSGGIGVALFATNATTTYVPLIISSNNPPFGVSNNAACLWNNGANLILRTSSPGSTNYYGDFPFPHIETGTTNATALTSFTATFTVPFSDTNYVATETGNGIALASSYVSNKTTNSCVFNMTVATGNIDWICTHR